MHELPVGFVGLLLLCFAVVVVVVVDVVDTVVVIADGEHAPKCTQNYSTQHVLAPVVFNAADYTYMSFAAGVGSSCMNVFSVDNRDILISPLRFEQSMSMELSDAGVSVAFLPDVTFRHVGAGQSAYETNNMRRPWD